MRTKVLTHFHTFHPEAQERLEALAEQERRLVLALARRGEVDPDDPPRKRRMSEPLEDVEADLQQLRDEMDEQRKIIASGVVNIAIKALTRGEFRRLLVQHPPREDDPQDVRLGYNVDTFGEALIQASIVRTFAHEMLGGGTVPNEWDEWADEMTNGQWEEVFRACMTLTNSAPSFPR